MNLNHKKAFTLAEMMVVMLILSLVTAAFLPVITTRSKANPGSIWRYATNNTDIYFGTGGSQGAAIGTNSLGGNNTRLALNTITSGTQDAITFMQGGTKTGSLIMNDSGAANAPSAIGLGNVTLPTGNTYNSNAIAIGNGAQATKVATTAIGGYSDSDGRATTAIEDFATAIGNGARSTGNGSTAIGEAVGAAKAYGIAIGSDTYSQGFSSIAIGGASNANTDYSICIGGYDFDDGVNTSSNSNYGISIGNGAYTEGASSTAIGKRAQATDDKTLALGSGAHATGSQAIALGEAKADNTETIAIGGWDTNGGDTHANAYGSIAIGHGAQSLGIQGIALGFWGDVSGVQRPALSQSQGSLAIGAGAQGTAYSSIAIGTIATSNNSYGIAIGDSTQALASGSITMGHSAYVAAANTSSIAIGDGAAVWSGGVGSITIGGGAQTSSPNAVAIGQGANVGATDSIAIGESSSTKKAYGTSIGVDSSAWGSYSTSLGGTAGLSSGWVASTGDYTVNIGPFTYTAGQPKGIAIGAWANAQADCGTAIGYEAGQYNWCSGPVSTGQFFINIGTTSYSGAAQRAVAVGPFTMATGASSIALGDEALVQGGTRSIAIGRSAGETTEGTATAGATGSDCISIGYHAYTSTANNAIAIGRQASATANGSVAIGADSSNNGATTAVANEIKLGTANHTVNIPGMLKIGTMGAAGGSDLYINGGTVCLSSDRRLKNISGKFEDGLNKIRQLNVYNFTFKKDKEKTKHTGVMAQDLKKVFPNAVMKSDNGYLMIRQEDMFYAMINSIKQLDKIVQGVIKDVKALAARVQQVEDKVIALIKVDQINSDKIKSLEAKNKMLEARLNKLEKLAKK